MIEFLIQLFRQQDNLQSSNLNGDPYLLAKQLQLLNQVGSDYIPF